MQLTYANKQLKIIIPQTKLSGIFKEVTLNL
jgi:hypothetical protein